MEIRPLRDSELDRAFDLDADAFHVAVDRREAFVRLHDPERIVGAFDGERLIAMTAALPFGQFFGGRSVPMGGLSSVAVVPDARGRGVAGKVVRACLRGMHERGEVISSLYPASTSLYRGMGWEVAGNYLYRKLAASALRGVRPPATGRTRPRGDHDQGAMEACYLRVATPSNGFLDREGSWWDRLRTRWQDRDAYLFENESGEVDGYVVYHQVDGEATHLGGPFDLVVDDLVAATRDAALALWGLLGSWSSQVTHLFLHGGADDPVLLVLPEQAFEPMAEIRWMTRVVDAAGAVAARGYASALDLEVPFLLHDAEFPGNDGGFVLAVRKGEGRLEPASRPEGPRLPIHGFSSLYTGWATTAGLRRSGLLEGGTPDQCAALDAAFAGPTPWMMDEF